MLIRICFILSMFFLSSNAMSAELEPECLQTFNVDKERIVSFNEEPVSCRQLEGMKNAIAERYQYFGGDLSLIVSNAKFFENQLNDLEKDLKENQDFSTQNEVILVNKIGGAVAVIGIATCVIATGGTCTLALIGGGVSIYGLFDLARSRNQKLEIIKRIRKDLVKARKQLEANQERIPLAFDLSVKQFNLVCGVVKDKCL